MKHRLGDTVGQTRGIRRGRVSKESQEATNARIHHHLEYGQSENFTIKALTDCLDLPGYIYPIWGCDHFMRSPYMSAYLYQLFNYIASKPQKTEAQS